MKNNYLKKTIETPIWLLISTIAIIYSINIYYGNIYLNSTYEGDTWIDGQPYKFTEHYASWNTNYNQVL